jgi:hypothetical protein
VTTPGWSTVPLVVVLAALREFEIKRVTLTALADAAVMSDQKLETDEELIEMGAQKVLGRMEGDSIKAHPLSVSAQISTRQAHSGQTELVSVEFAGACSSNKSAKRFAAFAVHRKRCIFRALPRGPSCCTRKDGALTRASIAPQADTVWRCTWSGCDAPCSIASSPSLGATACWVRRPHRSSTRN